MAAMHTQLFSRSTNLSDVFKFKQVPIEESEEQFPDARRVLVLLCILLLQLLLFAGIHGSILPGFRDFPPKIAS